MRLVSYETAEGHSYGLLASNGVVDLPSADNELPSEIQGFLCGGLAAIERAKVVERLADTYPVLALESLRLLPPVPKPGKIICLGLNYEDHAAETGNDRPSYPVVFLRSRTSMLASGDAMEIPCCSNQLDFEGELAVVIGKTIRQASRENALEAVAGYSVFNDGTIRDYQKKTKQWTIGKNFDRTGGFGPWLVMGDQIPAGGAGLRIQTRLNGVVVQDGNTSDMIFDVGRTIVYLSEAMTLEPGDVIAMGTPPGVGAARKPQLWMREGDVCEVEIEQVGVLSNTVQAAQ